MTPEHLRELERLLAPRDQGGTEDVQGIPNDINLQRTPGAISPAPYQPIDSAQVYQPQGETQGGLDQPSLPGPSPSPNLSGWADSPEQGGLGIAGPGPQPLQPETLDEHFARQLFPDFKGNLGYWDKVRLRTGMMDAIPNLAAQRQATALHFAQLEEQKRQHNWGVAEKLISSGNIEALDKFGDEFPPAKVIAQAVSKQDLAELPTFMDRGYLDPQFVQRLVNPQPGAKLPSAGEIRSHVDMAKSMYKEDVKVEAKNRQLEMALNTPQAQRRPSQQQLVDEHQSALDLKNADTELKKAQAAKARMEAQRGPIDHSEMNKTHESMFGVPWAQGTPETQSQARDATWKGRTQAHMEVASDTPVGQSGKAQEFRDPVSGNAAPSWATPKQLQSMGFVNIEPTQVQTVSQLRNVDAAMKEILGAGTALVRKETGSTLFDIPMGFLQTPIISLIKKYAGDPNAALLESALSRIAPSMAKLAGDTGNIAVAEQQIYKDAVFSNSDTLESFAAKLKSIMQAQKRTRAALGFVDDDRAYVRRLAIQGKTDEQIKAILEERKRMQ